MEKVEQYIKEYTRNCSNEIIIPTLDGCSYTRGYTYWLTPDHARCVAQIAREETIKEVCEYIKDNLYKNLYVYNGEAGFPTLQFIEDLKKHMEDNL